jgi:hypothetical protein
VTAFAGVMLVDRITIHQDIAVPMAAPLFYTHPMLRPAQSNTQADQTAERPRFPREEFLKDSTSYGRCEFYGKRLIAVAFEAFRVPAFSIEFTPQPP